MEAGEEVALGSDLKVVEMPCKPPVEYADARSVAQLAEPLRSRIAQAINDAPNDGLVLVSGKRTDYQQWVLRNQRVPGHECDPAYKGVPTTAVPGRSNHRNLSASVAAADMGGRDLDWLIANEKKYGINRPVRGEKWHFEVYGTPTVPIRPFGAKPPVGRWIAFRSGATDESIYARGGLDNEVSEVQIRLSMMAKTLNDRTLDPGPIDGDYGPTSQKAMSSFKRRIIALQKATGQDAWPNDDPYVGPKTINMLRWWT